MLENGPGRREGGCFCGAIRYALTEVYDAGYCHCSICRRTSGTPVLAWGSVREADFRLLRGTPKSLRTSDHGRREFCADCGTHLFYRANAETVPVLIGFHLATLDDPSTVRPRLHLFAGERIDWFDTADKLPRYDDNRIPPP